MSLDMLHSHAARCRPVPPGAGHAARCRPVPPGAGRAGRAARCRPVPPGAARCRPVPPGAARCRPVPPVPPSVPPDTRHRAMAGNGLRSGSARPIFALEASPQPRKDSRAAPSLLSPVPTVRQSSDNCPPTTPTDSDSCPPTDSDRTSTVVDPCGTVYILVLCPSVLRQLRVRQLRQSSDSSDNSDRVPTALTVTIYVGTYSLHPCFMLVHYISSAAHLSPRCCICHQLQNLLSQN